MNNSSRHNHIDFVEFAVASKAELASNKSFYSSVFGWTYKDWGDEYADTQSSGVGSGFNAHAAHSAPTLAVIYVNDLEAALQRVLAADGKIVKEIFSFPGGRRFHFSDPTGNELAVWSDK